MPPPGCPIPDWVYPGRVLRSRHNPEAHVWIDSIRYAENGDFYVALRSVLSVDPLVVNRFCVTEAWAIGFRTVYMPTDQWEPHPRFEWDEELQSQFLDDDQTCEIALRDGSRTWNIESMGVEGSRITLGVSREVIDEEVPDGEMEAVGEPYRRLEQQGSAARRNLPHLMMPRAETIPLNDPWTEEEQADLNAMLDQAEVDPDMRVFTQRPLEGFQRIRADGPPTLQLPAGVTGISMSTTVPHQLDAPQNNPLWPVWLLHPPPDGHQWFLRILRNESSGSVQMALPDAFRPHDELVWVTDDAPGLVNIIGTVGDYQHAWTEPVNVPIVLVGGTRIETGSAVLRRIMSATMPAVGPNLIHPAPPGVPSWAARQPRWWWAHRHRCRYDPFGCPSAHP